MAEVNTSVCGGGVNPGEEDTHMIPGWVSGLILTDPDWWQCSGWTLWRQNMSQLWVVNVNTVGAESEVCGWRMWALWVVNVNAMSEECERCGWRTWARCGVENLNAVGGECERRGRWHREDTRKRMWTLTGENERSNWWTWQLCVVNINNVVDKSERCRWTRI